MTNSEPGRFPLVLKLVVVGSKLKKVLIDSVSGLNVLFTKTLKKMKLDITDMLTKSASPFYDIVPGNAAIPLGSVVLRVTIGILCPATSIGGTCRRVDSGDHQTWNSKVCAGTQDLYRFRRPE
jgi:hypothetical protein